MADLLVEEGLADGARHNAGGRGGGVRLGHGGRKVVGDVTWWTGSGGAIDCRVSLGDLSQSFRGVLPLASDPIDVGVGVGVSGGSTDSSCPSCL